MIPSENDAWLIDTGDDVFVKRGCSGLVVPVNLGTKVAGLAEAKDRLARLLSRDATQQKWE